jgi:lipopolysaccharide/colanic/teichoic acid biosynthesis glycosyltransferase
MANVVLSVEAKTRDFEYAGGRSPLKSRSKRIADLIVAIVMLVVFFPVMLTIYVLVRLDGGPGFFLHERVGAGCRPFRCIKFRTMTPNAQAVLAEALAKDPRLAAEWRDTQKLRNDPRVTALGVFLRKTSLDELPQIFNVLLNDMSLVGPRPITLTETEKYGAYLSDYSATLPGITGLWQVSGRSQTSYERRVELDVQYVTEWSFLKDVQILLKTVPVVLLRQGAH